MKNYWRLFLSLLFLCSALSLQAAVKSFTESFVLYTNSYLALLFQHSRKKSL